MRVSHLNTPASIAVFSREERKNGRTFSQFMELVDSAIESRTGQDCESLPRYDYYREFVSGVSPADCAKYAVENCSGLN